MKARPTGATSLPKHFYSLDALRGVAALAVVLYHWRFLVSSTWVNEVDSEHFPFNFLLKPFYAEGGRAVELFFCLSGFIFYWLYSNRIRQGTVSLREFWVLRFSRLYPLHFLTLLFVAGAQAYAFARYGTFLIFDINDLKHFILHLGFASSWGLEDGPSFNAPVWSVSIEILLYGVFFMFCSLRFDRWWQILILAAGGYLCLRYGVWEIGRGLLSFFMGGLAYFAVLKLRSLAPSRRTLWLLTAGGLLLWGLIPWEISSHRVYAWWLSHSGSMDGGPFGQILQKMTRLSIEVVLFPCTLVVLALWESERGTLGRRLHWLGNISYSSYLIHIPLQLAFLLITLGCGIGREFFATPFALLLYFAILIPLSLLSYEYFERPCQSWLRARLLHKTTAPK